MKGDKKIEVFYRGRIVGTLALTPGKLAAFAYADPWLSEGFSISPFSLPLKKAVFVPQKDYFGGLFGVFADSLPDAWGNLLLNRLLRKRGIRPETLTVLERLAIVGDAGMGALTYHPKKKLAKEAAGIDLDQLADQCREILNTAYTDKLDELYALGGTSGGARPKILTQVDGRDWLIKFPAYTDEADAGKMEYDYACCAAECGIAMSRTRLFPSKKCAGYFGTERFDRRYRHGAPGEGVQAERLHMLTAAALLELDFEQPSLDYHALMKLTRILTGDNPEDVENMFLRMCFNVFAHNRDDHSKNFSYLYEEETGSWRLAPAYDLTYSDTYYGEHTTTVDGNGRDPGRKELLAVGRAAGLKAAHCETLIGRVEECVHACLRRYL